MVSAGTTAAAIVCFLALVTAFKVPSHVWAIPAGLDVNNHQLVNVTPVLVEESVLSKEFVRCARVSISGLSRLNLGSYSSVRRLRLVPSDEIHEKSYKKIHICLHSNSSHGPCQCESDMWHIVHGGSWNSLISPYEDKYIDVKFVDNLSGYVTLTIKLDFQRWRLICLAIGLVLVILAPIISNWVPFYYSSSMAIGICLVVIIILFQGMKLLPTARKNTLYSTLSALALGAGSFLLSRISMFVNSILVNFGISQEMHNPVLVFFLLVVALSGAGFGYWFVRKFIVEQDGSVDVSVSQFVKWALRVIAMTFVFQSTLDTPLSLVMLASLVVTNFTLTHFELGDQLQALFGSFLMHFVEWRPHLRTPPKVNKSKKLRAEFRTRNAGENLWRSPKRSSLWSNTPMKGVLTPPSSHSGTASSSMEYYSDFHNIPYRRKFSEEEWKDFTEESTRGAVSNLVSSPEFTDWIIEHADRVHVKPEASSDDSFGSGSDLDDKYVTPRNSESVQLRSLLVSLFQGWFSAPNRKQREYRSSVRPVRNNR